MIANLLPGTDGHAQNGSAPLVHRNSRDLVSLDSYWRAAGRPIGRHPRLWVELAAPLILGLADYLAGLSDISPSLAPGPRIIEEANRSAHETGEHGDLLAHWVLAQAYSAFLRNGPC